MALSLQLALTVAMVGLFVILWVWLSHLEGIDYASTTPEEKAPKEKLGGLARWLTTVDHQDIGILYGVFSTVMLGWGGLVAILMRLELLTPTAGFLSRDLYNALLTTHGLTMLFLFATPMIGAFVNYVLPLLVGADDMAFPRVNAVAFWLLPPASIIMWAGFLLAPFKLGVAPPKTAWTMYPPLSVTLANSGVDLMLLGLHLSGISTTMSAINFITTIITSRDETVTWATLDIFSWTILAQSGLVLFAFPVLGSAIVLLLFDRNFGTTFFTIEGGGPLLYQQLFWFFGHPEVYILVLPAMGIVSLLLPRFAGHELFGFKFVVYSTLAIGVLSYGVWAHHMFTTGMNPQLAASFMAVSLAIAVPSAVKTFNWIATLWGGRLRLAAPMLFCLGFVQNFIVGGVTGVFLAAIPFDYLMHDTYYVVGHFHFIIFGAIAFALFAASYYWFPLVTGRMYHRGLSRWHFWLSLVGSNVTFFAMLILGYQGMPRRYATYPPSFALWHRVATVGALLMGIGTLLWAWNMLQSALAGPTVDDRDPWHLGETDQRSNEWQWFDEHRVSSVADGGSAPENGDTETDHEGTDP